MGNKADLKDKREVLERANEQAGIIRYVEASAATGTGMSVVALMALVDRIVGRREVWRRQKDDDREVGRLCCRLCVPASRSSTF